MIKTIDRLAPRLPVNFDVKVWDLIVKRQHT
jgi:hypothetical protein